MAIAGTLPFLLHVSARLVFPGYFHVSAICPSFLSSPRTYWILQSKLQCWNSTGWPVDWQTSWTAAPRWNNTQLASMDYHKSWRGQWPGLGNHRILVSNCRRERTEVMLYAPMHASLCMCCQSFFAYVSDEHRCQTIDPYSTNALIVDAWDISHHMTKRVALRIRRLPDWSSIPTLRISGGLLPVQTENQCASLLKIVEAHAGDS